MKKITSLLLATVLALSALLLTGCVVTETPTTNVEGDVYNVEITGEASMLTAAASKAMLSAVSIQSSYSYQTTFGGVKTASSLGSGVIYSMNEDRNDAYIVTNYHVIEGASSALIQLADEKSVYEVEGIYHYSEENDWAVIKVKGSGFNYIPINTEEALTTGSVVYALGSPLGLQNTFSEGIISNPKRVIEGTPYIQITAPISHGSSGGALLNKYGEVIGITSAGFADAQNLNLAVPLTIVDMSKNPKITDEEIALIKSAQSGNIQAYNKLYYKYYLNK